MVCLAAGFWRMLLLLRTVSAEASCFLAFAAGQGLKQVVIGQGTKFLRPLAEVVERRAGKDSAALLQAVERGEGNTVSAIELLEEIKELSFELAVRAAALCVLGLRLRGPRHARFSRVGAGLRRGFGTYRFIRSHRCLSCR